MRALAIKQPWAWLIVNGLKDVENRDWKTQYRGPLLVHASKGMTRSEYEYGLETCHTVSISRPFPSGIVLPKFDDLERGGIVGMTNVTDCVAEHESPWFFGDFGFVLKDSRPLPFMPYKGVLGFFDVPYAL